MQKSIALEKDGDSWIVKVDGYEYFRGSMQSATARAQKISTSRNAGIFIAAECWPDLYQLFNVSQKGSDETIGLEEHANSAALTRLDTMASSNAFTAPPIKTDFV